VIELLEFLETRSIEVLGMRAADPLLILGVTGIGIVLANRYLGDSDKEGSSVMLSVSWLVIGVYWAMESLYWAGTVQSPTPVRPWVGYTLVGVVFVCLYFALLSMRGSGYLHEATVAFFVMGAFYIPFTFVPSVRELRMVLTAEHTAWLVSVLGYSASAEGTTVAFHREGPNTFIKIVSACTGFSVMALFVGLFTFSSRSIKRRAVAASGVVVVLYVANLIRNAMLVIATGTGFYDFVPELISPLYQMEQMNSYWTSFYVTEFAVAPIYVSVVLAVVYFGVVRKFPRIDEKVFRLNNLVAEDLKRVLRRL
jgi:archaeosortase A (PGF-CTERM-specific)